MGRIVFSDIETRDHALRRALQITVAVLLAAGVMSWLVAAMLYHPAQVLPAAISGLAFPAAILPWMTFQAADSTRRLRESQSALADITTTDQTTRLLNRKGFADRARLLFETSRREKAPLTAVVIDVDHLVAINQEHGHGGGDAVLAQVAELLTMNIQPGVDLAARTGGAEFVLLLPEAEHGWACAFAERLRGTFANRPVPYRTGLIAVSASFGVATLTAGDEDADDLIRRAGQALRAAKSGGRNKIEVDGLPAALAA